MSKLIEAFLATIDPNPDLNEAAKIVINFLLPLHKETDDLFTILPEHIAYVSALRGLNPITAQTAKEVVTTLWDECSSRHPFDVLVQDGFLEEQTSSLDDVITTAIANQSGAVADFKGGKKSAFGRVMGEAMKLAGKAADPQDVKARLEAALSL